MKPPLTASRPAPAIGVLACVVTALLLASCSSGPRSSGPQPDPAMYGRPSAEDPWGPYIRAASARFDVPEGYVRTVMQIESGGRTTLGGRPIVSHAGAMGLMQVMPATFRELQRKHGLGPDPQDPWTNILAGTAYIREMYDLYGAPGFLAAYNCGPGCYGDYLAGRRSLPGETQAYLATGSRMLAALEPGVQVASAIEYRPREQLAAAMPAPAAVPVPAVVQAAAPAAPPPQVLAPAAPPVPVAGERRSPVVIAGAAPAITVTLPRGWAIQVGAFSTPSASNQAAERARRLSPDLRTYEVRISEVATSAGVLYRARLIGLDEQGASSACLRLSEMGAACVMVRES